jgi:sigma-B regulation protein RsbU (phosphoserine phosphatase)
MKQKVTMAQDSSFILTDYYKEQLKEIAFQGELRAESFATRFRFFFLVFLVLFALLGRLSGRPPIEFYFQLSAILVLIIYNFAVFFSLRKTGSYLDIFKFMSSFLEISLLTFVIGYTAYSQKNPSLVYSAPMVYVFFVLIALASIRNNTKTIIFAVAVLVFEYLGLTLFFYPDMQEMNQMLIDSSYLLKPKFLEDSGSFFIINAIPMGIFLILLYMVVTGGLILFAILNTSRTTQEQADLISNKEKQAILEENMRLSLELDVARQIQAMVLPTKQELQEMNDLDIAARMDPANEVGGDYYDVIPHKDGTVYIGIGDVTDHGLASGVVMLMTQSAFFTALQSEDHSLRKCLTSINTVLFSNIRNRMNDVRNLTLSFLSYKNGVIKLSGQHENVIHYKASSKTAEVIDTVDLGMMVGLTESIEEFIQEKEIILSKGDYILLYTDGATEAENKSKTQYSLKSLKESLTRNISLNSPQSIIDKMYEELYMFMDGMPLYDDITLVLIKRN